MAHTDSPGRWVGSIRRQRRERRSPHAQVPFNRLPVDQWSVVDHLVEATDDRVIGFIRSFEAELGAALFGGTRALGLQANLEAHRVKAEITLYTDNQPVLDHSDRHGHSTATKNIGVRGLWLQEKR